MSNAQIHDSGISLERIVTRLNAKLKEKSSFNNADYYDYCKGIYDGIASCLEKIQEDDKLISSMPQESGERGARFKVFLKKAINNLREVDVEKEDPDKFPMSVDTLVCLLGIIDALYENHKIILY